MTRYIDFKLEDVTRRELSKVLLELGFQDRSNKRYFRFFHPAYNAEIFFPQYHPDDPLGKEPLIATAVILEGKGVINNVNALEKLIQKSREYETSPC